MKCGLPLLRIEKSKAIFLPSDILNWGEQQERFWRVNESGCGFVECWERARSSGHYWARRISLARVKCVRDGN